jgi:protein-histidine N-methyltransferase
MTGEELNDDNHTNKDINFIDAPSDLIPGVYEGGLKTWECSIDLAAYLASLNSVQSGSHPQWIRGKHILEARLSSLYTVLTVVTLGP